MIKIKKINLKKIGPNISAIFDSAITNGNDTANHE